MRFLPVHDKKTRREFHELPARIYKHDPNWIRPWDHDIDKIFDPEQNKYFRHGEAERWILLDDKGATVGRVAAFVDERTARKGKYRVGGMGFFECIEDEKVAFALFDQCKAWLEARGIEGMDGPINFGEKNTWWGLLTEGFTPPPYGFNYNPPYYQRFFENYGFQVYYKGMNYFRPVMGDLKDRYKEKAERILSNPDYTFPRFSKKEVDLFAEAFMTIYNDAWTTHEGFQPLRKAQAMSVIKQLFPILDEDMVVFVFYLGEPAAFYINIPDINQIIKHLNGKFTLYHKLKFKYLQMTGACRKLFGIAYGVVKAHQRKGVEAAMALHAQRICQRIDRYDDYELGWLGDFNPAMHRIADMVGCDLYKTYVTYRKYFDDSIPFERRPIIGKKEEKQE